MHLALTEKCVPSTTRPPLGMAVPEGPFQPRVQPEVSLGPRALACRECRVPRQTATAFSGAVRGPWQTRAGLLPKGHASAAARLF